MEDLVALPLDHPKTGMPGTGVHPQDHRAHIKASSSWSGMSKLANTSLTSSCSSSNSTSLSTCWAAFFFLDVHRGFGVQLHLRQDRLKPPGLQGFLDFEAEDRVGEHLELTLIPLQVVGAAFQGGLHEFFLIHAFPVEDDDPFLIKHPGDAAGLPQAAAVFGDEMTDVGHGAVLVVGEAFHHQGHPGRTVAFQGHLFQRRRRRCRLRRA